MDFSCRIIVNSVTAENIGVNYLEKGEVRPGVRGIDNDPRVTATITTSFLILIGIFFPSVTGICTCTLYPSLHFSLLLLQALWQGQIVQEI